MPQRTSAPNGAPCWIELFTSDADRSTEFYGELFGWTAEGSGEEFGGYVNFLLGGVPVAGCMRNDQTSGAPDTWSVYLASDDAETTVATAVAQGAEVIVAPMDVMGLGTMAFVTDPSGAAVGIWQPGTHRGFEVMEEPAAPAWFELHTRDLEAAVAFYRDVFGVEPRVQSDTDDFRYTTLCVGEQELAGVMDGTGHLPDGVPSHWAIYFGTKDADADVATVERLGGSVLMAPEDTPYGRLAWVADPLGTQFRLVQG